MIQNTIIYTQKLEDFLTLQEIIFGLEEDYMWVNSGMSIFTPEIFKDYVYNGIVFLEGCMYYVPGNTLDELREYAKGDLMPFEEFRSLHTTTNFKIHFEKPLTEEVFEILSSKSIMLRDLSKNVYYPVEYVCVEDGTITSVSKEDYEGLDLTEMPNNAFYYILSDIDRLLATEVSVNKFDWEYSDYGYFRQVSENEYEVYRQTKSGKTYLRYIMDMDILLSEKPEPTTAEDLQNLLIRFVDNISEDSLEEGIEKLEGTYVVI